MNSRSTKRNGRIEIPSLRGWPLASALLLILFELSWVAAYYRAFIDLGNLTSLPAAMAVLGGIMLVSYLVAYQMDYAGLNNNTQLGILAVFLLLSLVVGGWFLLPGRTAETLRASVGLDPGLILMFIFVVWMWQRGIGMGRMTMRPEIAWRRFQVGLVLFLGIIFFINWTGGDPPGIGWFFTFLLLGFLSMLGARAAYVNVAAGESRNPLDWRWIAGMAAILTLVIFLVTVLGSLLTGQWSLLLDWLALGISFLARGVMFIAAIPALAFSFIFGNLFVWLRELLAKNAADAPPELDSELLMLDTILPPPQNQVLSPAAQSFLFWGIALIALIVLFVLLRRRSERLRLPTLGEPESLLEPGEAGKLLRQAVQDSIDDLLNRLRPKPPPPDISEIRKIYIRLLILFYDLGLPRPDSKTPLEFQRLMAEKMPGVDQELDALTQVYLSVRYGNLSETRDESELAARAWGVIEDRQPEE